MEAKPVSLTALGLSLFAVLGLQLIVGLTSLGASLRGVGATRLVQILLMVWIAAACSGGLASIGLERSGWFRGLQRGLLWSLAFGAVALCGFFLLFLAGVNALDLIRAPVPPRALDLAFLFLIGGIVAPVAEEIFFRGLLYGFCRRWGVAAALIISTFLFVLSHPLDRGLPLTQLAGGIVFAVSYEVEGSLLVPITIHVSGNLAIFALSALA